jgi:hypothetical protein
MHGLPVEITLELAMGSQVLKQLLFQRQLWLGRRIVAGGQQRQRQQGGRNSGPAGKAFAVIR